MRGAGAEHGAEDRLHSGLHHWTDLLRWAGIGFSAAAVFLGLYAQSGVAFVPALIIALCVALVMAAAHAMYASAENAAQIGEHVRSLKAAIATLSDDLNRVELAAMNFAGVEKLDQYVREFGRLNQDLRYISVTSEHLQDITRLAAQLDRLRTLTKDDKGARIRPEGGTATPPAQQPPAAVVVELERARQEESAGGADGPAATAPADSNVTEIEQFRGLVDRIRRHTEGRRCDGSEEERKAFLADLGEALDANRVDFLVQPVLSLPERKPVMYQAAIELRDLEGCSLHFAGCLADGQGGALVPALDDRIVYKSLQMIQRLKKGHHVRGVFCPLDARSVCDEDFFAALLEAIGEAASHKGDLVFEITHDDLVAHGDALTARLKLLAGRGYHFALAGGEAFDMDLRWLHRLGMRYFKLDAGLFRDGFEDGEGGLDEQELLLSLREAELVPVFCNIDEKELLEAVSDYGPAWALGRAVAKPMRVEIEDFLDEAAEEDEEDLPPSVKADRPHLALVEDWEPETPEPDNGKQASDDDAA